MTRIVVDPVTRIEGHLRIEAVVENGKITDAFSSGTMVRGIEKILKGRDPRDAWAFVERVCGVCTTVHALASVRAVEDAIQISVPKNAELVRNIMFCTQYVHDHVVHFYHLHALDWVDVVAALSADPVATSDLAKSLSNWSKTSPGYFSDIQQRLKSFVGSGQLGIFANGYWGHSAFKLPKEVNLLGVAHYLEALEWQKEIVKIHAIFGGKNPHPNYLVGGVPCSFNLEEVNAINTEKLNLVGKLIKDAMNFVEQVYIPDLMAIAGFYKDWAAIGGGLQNYLAYGDLPTKGYAYPDFFKFPRGAILNRDLTKIHEVNGRDSEEIKEYIAHSWYKYEAGDTTGLHPWKGETEFNFTGPKPPFENLNTDGKYSWLKTPRWRDNPMEVGPLARLLVGYAKGSQEIKEVVDEALKKLDVPLPALFSTLGRTASRGLETRLVVRWLKEFYDELIENLKKGDLSTFTQEKWEPATWNAECEGVGLSEAPRGALAHWIRIKERKIDNYQLVVPSTWNASPRDAGGKRSAYEESLIGTPVAKEDEPLEIIRTIHSFDPCLACAVHLYDPDGKPIHQVTVN
jgi:hydrogenase large subunit